MLALLAVLVGCQGLVRLGRHRPPPGRFIVVHVGLVGNKQVADSEVLGALEVFADNFGSLDSKPLLDLSGLDEDARRIESAYAALGYFDARCTGHRVEPVDDVSVRVFFTVREGRPTKLATLDVAVWPDPAVDPAAAERLLRFERKKADLLALEPQDVWSEGAYSRTRDALRDWLRTEGFLYAEVLGNNRIDRLKRRAEVRFDVVPGPLPRIGDVVVLGSAGVQPSRALRRVDLRRGDIVDARRFEKVEGRLFGLGVFQSVSVRADRVSLEVALGERPASLENVRALEWPREARILVTLQEMPFQEVRVGAGLAFDNARNEVSVPIEYRHRSLFGGERHFDLSLRPAYLVLPSFAQADQHGPAFKASLQFSQPAFLEEYLTLGLGSTYNLELRERGFFHEVSATVSLSRTFFDLLTPSISYRVDFNELIDGDAGTTIADLDRYLLTYLEQALTLDWRDNLLDARNGVYARVAVAESFAALGSGFDFLRLEGDLRGYVRAGSFLTLAARVAYSHNFSFSDVYPPTSVWFTGGGASDMRGFASQAMGPTTCRAEGETEETLVLDGLGCPEGATAFSDGGNVKFLSSVEARFYLPYDFGVVAFADFGQLWTLSDVVDWGDVEIAVGGGLRYYTIIGAIRFDVGYLLTHPGEPDPALHLSIGQAF